MDNPLTPKKIQRLINLAEGRSFNMERLLLTDEEVKIVSAKNNSQSQEYSPARYESSSGIIDLDRVEAFGEASSVGNMSFSKSTAFNPGEMTGRSTEEAPSMSGLGLASEKIGRHSIAIDSITNKMNKQTNEIQDLMRNSIATNYSFNSKRDLTADEASFVAREAPLPVLQNTQSYFTDTQSVNNSNLSVGAYFGKRCTYDIGKILGNTHTPDKSYMMPSITEVSGTYYEQGQDSELIRIDDTLDSVPVRQPRNSDNKIQDKTPSVPTTGKEFPRHIFKEPARMKPVEQKPESHFIMAEKRQNARLTQSGNPHRSVKSSMKPTDVLLKNMQASFKVVSDDTEETIENSISLSKIADYIGNQSNVSVTDMLQLQQKPGVKKQPLTELNMNKQNTDQVAYLVDSKKTETASSAGTVQTVISLDKLKICEEKTANENKNKIPKAPVPPTLPLLDYNGVEEPNRRSRSKSPSSKTPSTLSTVRENDVNKYCSFKSDESPIFSKEEANRSKVPSPNVAYKQLDKSVDWQEVLHQKKLRQRAKDKLVEIDAKPVDGFIGVTTAVTIPVTSLTDTWLTAKFQLDNVDHEKDLNIELPRLPLLLSPGKSEDFTFHITSSVEIETTLPFTFHITDDSRDGDVEHKGELEVNFKIPAIQAMSSDGLNKLTYPVVPEKTPITRTFVLISDCPADLQLKLAITEGEKTFCIKNVQEIKKTDVNKVLLERQSSEDTMKPKTKTLNKQLCRLVKDSAIRVAITFNAPKLDMKLFGKSGILTGYNGALLITLIDGNTVLRKVDLIGLLGIPKLHVNAPGNKIHVSNNGGEKITVSNLGSVVGTWSLRYHQTSAGGIPFEFTPVRFSLGPEATSSVQVFYKGKPEDGLVQVQIFFEELTTGESTGLILTGGVDKPMSFPIKTNAMSLSWVRAGRKEISLKNNIDKKVHVRCQIEGEGFSVDLPGGESRGQFLLSFNGMECRPLSIVFAPTSNMPHSATLRMVQDRCNDGTSRKIFLFGCMSGEPVRWSGLVTYSDTAALVRATGRAPIDLQLHNKSVMAAFVAAKVHFNLQYMQVAPFCRLVGANRVVAGRARHAVSLQLDWPRVERKAREAHTTSLATVTVLTGAEATRRRILKILKNESQGELDTSLLPEHLKVLAQEFEGEDPAMDNLFADYSETKASLNELIHCGLQELTAHIDLPQDFAEETTILITDDTVLDHHTMCD